MSEQLSATDRQALEDKGFCILEDVFGESELEPKRQLVNDIIRCRKDGYVDPFTEDTEYLDHEVEQGVLHDIVPRVPAFRDMACADRVLDTVESVLGPNIYLYDSSVVYKPKGARNEVPPHQDFISRPDESVRYIAWMPLYDVSVENGCLKAIPGSHKDGYLSWHREEGEAHHDRLDEDQYDPEDMEYLEMDAGDVLLFHHLVVHGSDRVDSDQPRHALRTVYKSPSPGDVKVPRSGPTMLRGGDPQSLRGENALVHESEVDLEPSPVKQFGYKILKKFGIVE